MVNRIQPIINSGLRSDIVKIVHDLWIDTQICLLLSNFLIEFIDNFYDNFVSKAVKVRSPIIVEGIMDLGERARRVCD